MATKTVNDENIDPSTKESDQKSVLFYVAVCFMFVASGSISTIASKWNDTLEAPGRDGNVHEFNHPFIQTWLMFVGEFTCLVAFYILVFRKKSRGEPLVEGEDFAKPMNRLIFAIPACCDFTASTTMYYALTMTQASVYQMLRGATVIFTAALSRIFLKRRFQLYQWFGMFIVTTGLACVGLASTLFQQSQTEAKNPVLGDILVICAQVIVAGQMIIEEKILTHYNVPPILLVGWEGVFGMCYTSIALGIFQAWPAATCPDDFIDGFTQMFGTWQMFMSVFLALLSFPILNGTGQVITKNISATARMVLDTVRNVVVWVFTLAYTSYFHEKFQWLQLVGFILLIAGNAIYKYIIKIPCELCRDTSEPEGERASLLPAESPA